MSTARRHHFVPQFYLRNFVRDRSDPKLFVVDLERHKSFFTSPANLAVENDFHTISSPREAPDAVEKQLSTMETEVAPALRRIVEREYVGNDEIAELVLFFVALLMVKSPSMRETMNGVTATFLKHVSTQLASDPDAWNSRMAELVAEGVYRSDFDGEGLRHSILAHDFKIGLTPAAHMQTEFPTAVELTPLLLQRRWNVLRAREGYFVTCDRPAVLMWADPANNAPIGLILPNTRVLFPITSDIAICGGFELENATVDLDADGVAKVNGRTIINARHQVFARDSTFGYCLSHNEGMRSGQDLAAEQMNRASSMAEGDERPTTDPLTEPGTFRRANQKIGRNEPCPCGSEKKYKRCHGVA